MATITPSASSNLPAGPTRTIPALLATSPDKRTGAATPNAYTGWIKEYVSFLAPILLYPGSMEMEALAQGIIRVLDFQTRYRHFLCSDEHGAPKYQF